MKKLFLALATVLAAEQAFSQSFIRTDASRANASSGGTFSLGPRYSNYSTDVDIDIATVDTGRQSAFGLTGAYRNGAFVLDFLVDHDPENGLDLVDLLPFEIAQYTRDRGEVMAGVAVLPFLDIQGGLRMDSVEIGNNFLFDGVTFDHQAFGGGIHLHTPENRPFGVYGLARGYVGSADFDEGFVSTSADTTGYRVEGGVVIPIGTSNWSFSPAVEFEHLESENNLVQLDTNRLMLNFIYRFPR